LSGATIARRAGGRRWSWSRLEPFVIGTASVIFGLLLWQVLADAGYLKPIIFSSPSQVADMGWTLIHTGALWKDVKVSLEEYLIGFGIGTVSGIAIGLAAGASEKASYLLDPWLDVLYVTPIVALTPLFILWFGIGMGFKIFIVVLVTLFPIAISTRTGARSSEKKLLEMVSSFGASRGRLIRTVTLPGAVPYIFTGMRQASGRAVVGVVVAELIASSEGIGFMISVGGSTFNTPQVMFGIVLLAAFGLAVSRLLALCERRFDKWRTDA
jgi:ABC-type nitrate/sulfonate/bicarbonate transport system permease component